MDPALVTRVIIVTAVTAAVMKIFGAKGFLITLALLAILLFLIYKNQNKILYMPDIPNLPRSPKDNPIGYRHPSENGMSAGNVEIITADNVKIKGWLVTHQNTERIIIYFHQNAGNIGMRIPYIKQLHDRTNSDILLVAYRGYSDSEGVPTEEGIQLDAQAIMEYAVNLKAKALAQGNMKDIYILGRSLGGAVSIYVATQPAYKHQIKGLILQNTFTSIQDMVKVLFPPLAHLKFLHRNFWPSKERIGEIETPILFVRCMKDEIVPTEQMEELIRLAERPRVKQQHQISNGMHNLAWEVDPPAYFAKLNSFFQNLEKQELSDK